jgi:hypothetical protein
VPGDVAVVGFESGHRILAAQQGNQHSILPRPGLCGIKARDGGS